MRREMMTEKEELNRLFEEAEKLLVVGRCDEALEMIGGIEKRNVEDTDRWRCEVFEGKCLTDLGEFEAALKISSKVVEEGKRASGYDTIVVGALIIVAESLWRLGQLDESLKAIEDAERMFQTLALHMLPLQIQTNSSASSQRAALLYHRGEIYRLQGDLGKALEYYQQSLSFYEEAGDRRGIAAALNMHGGIFWESGDLHQALDYFQRSLTLREKIGSKRQIGKSLNNMGAAYYHLGELDTALVYYQRGLKLVEEIDNKYEMIFATNNIGEVHFRKGDLDLALMYYERSLALREELGNNQLIALTLRNLGDVFFRKGNTDRAQDYYQRSLALREEIGNKLDISETLFSLLYVAISTDSIEKAQKYLRHLQGINEHEESKIIDQRCRLGEALVLKTSMRARNRAKAEELLEQITEEEIVAHELTVIALLNLCDLLLAELQVSGDAEILGGVQAYQSRLLEIAENQHSFWLLAETYVLQSKLLLLNLNVEEARRVLTQAQSFADEKGLRRLAARISNEHDALLEELDTWEELTQRQASLIERTNLARIDEHVEHMFRQSVLEDQDLVEEEPIMLIILSEDGFLVYSKTFALTAEVSERMIGGFVQAVQRISHEVFSQALDRIKFETYTLLIRSKDPLTFCYICKGQSYSAQQKLDQFIDDVVSRSAVWDPMLELAKTGRPLNPDSQAILDAQLSDVFAGFISY